MDTATTIDGFLNNAIEVKQPKTGAHRSGLDAVLLAAALAPDSVGHLADFGAGCGVAGMAAAHRCPGLHVDLLEVDSQSGAMSIDSLSLPANKHLMKRVSQFEVDLTKPGKSRSGLLREKFYSHIISNPPYNSASLSRSQNQDRARAHVAEPGLIEAWIKTAAFVARPKASLAIIIRPDMLRPVLDALDGRFGGARILAIHPKAALAANRLIITAKQASKSPIQFLPPVIVHNSDGSFTDRVESILRGNDWLRLK